MLLYNVHSVKYISAKRVRITLTPNWLGRLFSRRARVGEAIQGEHFWAWAATGYDVGYRIESYIEAAPVLTVDDMTVEQLLLDDAEVK